MTRMAPPPPAPAVELARPASADGRSKNVEEPFWVDERLSLDDSLRLSPLPMFGRGAKRAVPARRVSCAVYSWGVIFGGLNVPRRTGGPAASSMSRTASARSGRTD